MGAITPNMDRSVAGFVDSRMGLFGGVAAVTDNLNTEVNQRISNRNNLELLIFHFSDIDSADTWPSGISNIVAMAWQPEDPVDDRVRPVLTTQATGVVTFVSTNADSAGWLWVYVGAAGNRGPGV